MNAQKVIDNYHIQLIVRDCIKIEIDTYTRKNGISLFDFYNQAVIHFLSKYEDNNKIHFLSAPKKGTRINLWIDNYLADKLKNIADTNNSYVRRVMFTALIMYLDKLNIECEDC